MTSCTESMVIFFDVERIECWGELRFISSMAGTVMYCVNVDKWLCKGSKSTLHPSLSRCMIREAWSSGVMLRLYMRWSLSYFYQRLRADFLLTLLKWWTACESVFQLNPDYVFTALIKSRLKKNRCSIGYVVTATDWNVFCVSLGAVIWTIAMFIVFRYVSVLCCSNSLYSPLWWIACQSVFHLKFNDYLHALKWVNTNITWIHL